MESCLSDTRASRGPAGGNEPSGNHAVVLGGGPAGLSAAWKLAKAGHAVTVLERESHTGGLARTFSYRDFLFDYGPHSFHNDIPEVVREMKALLGSEFHDKKFQAKVVFRNKFVKYPLRGADVFTSVNPLLGAWCVIDFGITRLRHRLFAKQEEDNFKSWVSSRFGNALYNIYFGPYTKKVWGRDPEKLAGAFAAQRIPVLHLWDLIQRTFFRKRGGSHRHNPYADVSYYPRKGIGQISDRFTEEIISNGGKILTDVKVLGVRTNAGKVRSVQFTRGGQPEDLACDFLLSTVPIREFIPLFRPIPSQAQLGAADGIHYRSARLMYLLLDRERVSGTPWIYFSNPEVIFNRIYEIRVFSEDMTPAGKTALCVEITCDEGDETWSATDAALFPKIVGPLERAGLLKAGEVYDYFTRCLQYAYPIYEVGFEARMNGIMDFLDEFDNVLTYGRQGIFAYTNTDHSIHMGFRAAKYVGDRFHGLDPGTPKRDLYRDYSIGY